MQKHVLATIEQLNKKHTDATVLIVVHSGVMAALNASLLGVDFGQHNISEAYRMIMWLSSHLVVGRCDRLRGLTPSHQPSKRATGPPNYDIIIGMRRTAKNYRLLIGLLLGASVIVGVAIYSSSHTVTPKSRAEAWQSFKSYVASMELPDKTPIYSGTSTMGCSKDEAVNRPLSDCMFSGTYFYTLTGNYRDNGKQIYAFLQKHGFYFKDKDSQQKFESKLNDSTIADNLSNSEPIIVDLHNKNGIWVRFSLGDKGRLMTPGSADLNSALGSLPDQQLIASLGFYRTY
jgi:hypothetical protein